MIVHLCCKIEWSFKSYKSYSDNRLSLTSSKNEKIPFSRNRKQNSELDSFRESKTFIRGKIDIGTKKTIEKKKEKEKIIQTHSGFCDIEVIDDEYYLVNKKEAEIILMISGSLKHMSISNSVFIYTFNKAQVKLIKKTLGKELSGIDVILLNEECTNFVYSEYIIISYIGSKISDESRKKYPGIKPRLNSVKFYTEEFTNNILKNYTGKILYLVCNDGYLKNPEDDLDESLNSSNQVPIANIAEEIQVPIINRKFVTNEYNICFIIDNTGSMGSWINIIKEICHNLFVEVTKKFSEYDFYFGCVLYADKPSLSTDENFIISFTKDEQEFYSKLQGYELQNGDDVAEDWVSGFRIALDNLNWGNGTKLIFHIADAPAHGKFFNIGKKDDQFLDDINDKHGNELLALIKRCSERNIKITGISIDKVGSFKVFQKEYEKVNGPNYEIIQVDGTELTKGNNYMNEKILGIINNSISQNKAENFI